MKVTLLSCGPSLNLYDPGKDENELVVAVNRAAEYAPCDWWAMLDKETILFTAREVRKGILTTIHIANEITQDKDLKHLWKRGWVHHTIPRRNGLIGKTFTHALWAIGYHWKPDWIDVYGVDMEGADDYTGSTEDVRWNNDVPKRRSPKRWDAERKHVMQLFEEFPVRWHRPDGVREFPNSEYEKLDRHTGMPRRREKVRLPREVPQWK